LKALRAAGKKLGIVTASTLSSILYDFDTLGLPRQIIDYLQTEDDTAVHKPDCRVFDPAIKWLSEQNISVSEVVCVGDSLEDLEAAVRAGFKFVAVATGIVSMNEFMQREIPVVSNLSELCRGGLFAPKLPLYWRIPQLPTPAKFYRERKAR